MDGRGCKTSPATYPMRQTRSRVREPYPAGAAAARRQEAEASATSVVKEAMAHRSVEAERRWVRRSRLGRERRSLSLMPSGDGNQTSRSGP